ncbi:hypothetical protein BC830DRAFT_1141495 [Chytriomyces sp. MP71]|nr:hypothetical protein BC830DRAFT_1141495 [Chytriomyces sp. MP71]
MLMDAVSMQLDSPSALGLGKIVSGPVQSLIAELDPKSKPASKQSSLRVAKTAFVCSVCSKAFPKYAKLKLHEMSHTGEKPFKCQFTGCEKTYARKNHLDVHVLSHETSIEARKPFKCLFGAPSSLTSSNEHSDEEEGASDDEGDGAMSCTSSVSRLVRGGSDDRRCTARFSSLYHLQRHMKAHADPLPYKCPQPGCTMSFAKQVQLKKHESFHTGQLPYKCLHEGCDRHFASNTKMLTHAKSHSEDPRYLCGQPSCHAAFTKWSLLQAHIKELHKIICKACNATFTTKYSLKMHLKTHELETREVYTCTAEGCGKVFMTSSSRTVHIRSVHEKIRPYKCTAPECPAAFAHKHLLMRHLRKHIDIPELVPAAVSPPKYTPDPLPAELQKIDLITSITGHTFRTDKRGIVCSMPGCLQRFGREYDLSRHMDACHAGKV